VDANCNGVAGDVATAGLVDDDNCGGCGMPCSAAANQTVSCVAMDDGAAGCQAQCQAGFYDINGVTDDGCEYQCTVAGSEECNGVDDDCDGEVDEDTGRFYYTGDAVTIGIGACRRGREICVAGEMVVFAEERLPASEVCNGVDDDCDGVVDEGFGLGEECDGDDGDLCAFGILVCDRLLGVAVCGKERVSDIAEWCNEQDDDCDGMVDEEAIDAPLWYYDGDGDGGGDAEDPGYPSCVDPDSHNPETGDNSMYVDNNVDECSQSPIKTKPGVCGCSEFDVDEDNDGYLFCEEDCDSDPSKQFKGDCGCNVIDVDNDNDGFSDCPDHDACPTDPDKQKAGQCGCGEADTDTDLDGVANCNDGCPFNSNKTSAGGCGCNTADDDTDADGVLDCAEDCPNDPKKTLPGQCDCGTQDIDTDNDGTLDCNEECTADPNKTGGGICGCDVPDEFPNCGENATCEFVSARVSCTCDAGYWRSGDPGKRPLPRLASAGNGGAVMMLGGGSSGSDDAPLDLWVFFDSRWEQIETYGVDGGLVPSLRTRYATAFDSARNVLVMFGGYESQSGEMLSDTWELSAGGAWSYMGNQGDFLLGGAPGPRDGHVMTYHAGLTDGPAVVMFGGFDGNSKLADLWSYTVGGWYQIADDAGLTGDQQGTPETTMPTTPTARTFHGMVYHQTMNALLLFGGEDDAQNILGDTWKWDESGGWSDLSIEFSGSPGPRSGHAMAWDPAYSRAVVFGGFDGDTSSTLSDTWVFSESNTAGWFREPATAQVGAVEPPARQGAAIAFGGGSGTYGESMVLVGGLGPSGVLADTWSLRDAGWQQVSTTLVCVSDGPQCTPVTGNPLCVFGHQPAPDFGGIEVCDDGNDNDNDGMVDCDDPDCAGGTHCSF